MNTKNNTKATSFFGQFSKEEIFALWNNCNTLLELAQNLGFNGPHLSRQDYEYIQSIKCRRVWQQIISENRQKERSRPNYVKQLSSQDLEKVLDSPGIETVRHLALHYLLSNKHGVKAIRERVLECKLPVKTELHKGIFGVSSRPIPWPTKFFVKRKGLKPMICPKCNFQAVNSLQMEIHHQDDVTKGPKNACNPEYFRSPNVEVMCRNCHTLEHRTGEALQAKWGKWRPKPPGHQRYKNPDDIFSSNCQENYRMQKNYFLKWVLRSPLNYCCEHCDVSTWGNDNKVLSLELHHKDGNHRNSLLSNLELLCPNCHRAV